MGNDKIVMGTDRIPPLSLCLFGAFEARVHGAPLPHLRSRKGQWLLALLALHRGEPLDRAWLAGTLWPDSSEPQALHNLRMSLTDLRRALGPEADRLRSPTPRTLALDLTEAVVDLLAFDQRMAVGDVPSLEQAAALYRGLLLEECVEEWVVQERQAREQACLEALEKLAAHHQELGDLTRTERHLRRAVGIDPLRESAQRSLLQVLAAGGNYAAAIQLYRELRERLHRDVNAEPDPETRAVFEQIRQEARQRAAAPGRQDMSSPVVTRASRRAAPAAGMPTFLFTDIEGSTRLWEEYPQAMQEALARHDDLLHRVIADHGGDVFKTMGDQFCAAFGTAAEALAAALEAQRALNSVPVMGTPPGGALLPVGPRTGPAGHPPAWGPAPDRAAVPPPLRVRMALHAGAAAERDGDYFGPALNRLARLLQAGHGGQILLTQTARDLVVLHLPEGAALRDLGEQRLRDLSRPEPVYQLVYPDLTAEFPPLRSLAVYAHNLPAQLTRFIGRKEEIAEVEQLLAVSRLLTLTGAGGSGKTRLALQVAADVMEAYPDGVWLVELAPLTDPTVVPQMVAAVLGVSDESGRPVLEALADWLCPRSLLLVLDNCEHLVEACAALAVTLLHAAPGVRLLATSREALGVAGEIPWQVPTLPLPDPQEPLPLDKLTEYPAVQLFVDRATTAQPAFRVTPRNAPAITQVCRRLEGLPLAIELAAARVRVLSVEQIAARLDESFRLLTGGSRSALPHQQTLRAAIDWSYDLLTDAERLLLRRLSVFAGGWSLESAECVAAGDGLGEGEVLDLIARLVDKSLVLCSEQGEEIRYRMLETIRQYGRDRLQERGEAEPARDRHLDHFLALAERAAAELFGGDQGAWMDRLEAEHDNLRAALGWAQERGDAEAGLRLAGSIWRFWHVRGYPEEGRERLARLLDLSAGGSETAVTVAARAKALDGAAILAIGAGDYAAAQALYEELLAIGRERDDGEIVAAALNGLGELFSFQGRFEAALRMHEEALAVARQVGDQWAVGYALHGLGIHAWLHEDTRAAQRMLREALELAREQRDQKNVAFLLKHLAGVALHQGEYAVARSLQDESLAVWREVGEKRWIGQCLYRLGLIALKQGEVDAARSYYEEWLACSHEPGEEWLITYSLDQGALITLEREEYEAALPCYEECLAARRDADDRRGLAWTLLHLGMFARRRQECRTARRYYQECLPVAIELDDRPILRMLLEGVAGLAVAEGQAERTARILGAAEAHLPTGPLRREGYSTDMDQIAATARAQLGEEPFAAAWTIGQAMSLEEVVASVLQHHEMAADAGT
jgi:predicted ATPase/DNA-binding SARP family transcriptional activator